MIYDEDVGMLKLCSYGFYYKENAYCIRKH